MRVTSAIGTDLTINLCGAPFGGLPGFDTAPGGVAHWPCGRCLAFHGQRAVTCRILMGGYEPDLQNLFDQPDRLYRRD